MTDALRILQIVVGEEQARFQVFLFFINNPRRVVYPSELATILRLPEPSVRRALRFLSRTHILSDHTTRYRHYYRIHPVVPIEEFRRWFRCHYG